MLVWKKSLQSFVQLPLGVQERNKIGTQMLTDGDRSSEGEVTMKKERNVIIKKKENQREMVKIQIRRLWAGVKEARKQRVHQRILCTEKFKIKGVLDTTVGYQTQGKKAYE